MKALRPIALCALLPGLALGYPTTDRGALDGAASISDLSVSDDGRYIGASQRSADAGLAIWDRLAPTAAPELAEVCEATSVVWTTHSTRGDAFYVGCGNNEIVRVEYDSRTVPPSTTPGEPITVGLENDQIVAIAWAQGNTVLHVMTSGDNAVGLHAVSLADDTVNGFAGLPAQVVGSGTDLTVAAGTLGNVIGVQTDGTLLWGSRSGTTYSVSQSALVSGTPVGIAVDPDGVSGSLLVALSNGDVWEGSTASPSQFPALFLEELSSPQAIAFGPGTTTPVVYIANASRELAIYNSSTAVELAVVDLDSSGSPVRIVTAPDDEDTVYVAGGDGSVRVVTERPWVTSIEAAPTSVASDEEFTVTFSLDSDAAWDLRIGSGINDDAGTSLQTGTAEADEEITVTLNASDLTTEGSNRIALFATNSGATGVDSVTVTLDTPPDTVTNFTLEPGDARLVLNWTSSAEEDIASYRIFLSDAPFTNDEADLPEFTVETDDGDVNYPIEVPAGEPSSGSSTELANLDNEVTYWVALRPIDEADNEGPLSAILSGTPEQTCGLIECHGGGGCSCAQTQASPSLFAFALMALGLLGVRRRT